MLEKLKVGIECFFFSIKKNAEKRVEITMGNKICIIVLYKNKDNLEKCFLKLTLKFKMY